MFSLAKVDAIDAVRIALGCSASLAMIRTEPLVFA